MTRGIVCQDPDSEKVVVAHRVARFDLHPRPLRVEVHRSTVPLACGMTRFLLPVLGTLIAAVLGGLGSVRSGELYAALDKPAWAPPAGAFGPVWSALYVMIALAGVLLVQWRDQDARVSSALRLYIAQLALNALWPWLFFAWRLGGVALAEILLLWVVLVLTMLAFARIRPLAAALLVPYLLWVSYAAALTWAVWRANHGVVAVVVPAAPQ
jgi:benzodiazapine receptor